MTRDTLAQAIGAADPRTVLALVVAGLDVGAANAGPTQVTIVNGLATACEQPHLASERLALALDAVVEHGFPIGYADSLGNTVLLSAAQFCPGPVVAAILKLGAPANPVNKQNFTPLDMAFVSGKWDVARVLVDAGARISAQQADQDFFQRPDDPQQRALIERAIK